MCHVQASESRDTSRSGSHVDARHLTHGWTVQTMKLRVACRRSSGEYGVEMRHMWGMTELSPIGSCAGFKVGPRCCMTNTEGLHVM